MNYSALYLSVIQFYLLNHTQNIIEVAFCAKPNGRYIEVAVLQRAGIARVYCIQYFYTYNTARYEVNYGQMKVDCN